MKYWIISLTIFVGTFAHGATVFACDEYGCNADYSYIEQFDNANYSYLGDYNNADYSYVSDYNNADYAYVSDYNNADYSYVSDYYNADYAYVTPDWDYYDYDTYAYDYDYVDYYDYDVYGYDSYSYPSYTSYDYYSYPTYSNPVHYNAPKNYPVTVSSGQPSRASQAHTSSVTNNVDNSVRYSYVDNSIVNSFNTGSNINSPGAIAAGTSISITPVATTPVYHPTPSCTISVTGSFGYGQTLTWHTYNATSASISGVGAVTTGYGTRVVYPTQGQIFTMSVHGQGGSSTCQTSSYHYAAPVTPTYPVYSQVALSQIPYTGFDLGPVGNALFWVGLALFSIAGSYFIVYFRGGLMAFLRQTREEETVVSAPARVAYAAYVPATIVADELDDEAIKFSARDRVTRDSMGIDLSAGVPRIVVARQ